MLTFSTLGIGRTRAMMCTRRSNTPARSIYDASCTLTTRAERFPARFRVPVVVRLRRDGGKRRGKRLISNFP